MLTLTPDTAVIPQPVRALGIANTRRSAAAALKTQAAQARDHPARDPRQPAGRVGATDDLGGAAVDARDRPHPAARTQRPRDPRGHVNLAAPLGALTERQRNWLAGRLCR